MLIGSYSEKAGSLRNKKLSIVDIIHKQQASDEVKLCTCQIRTCAGEGEHMFASGRLVVWRNSQRQRVESVPGFRKSLLHD